MTSERADHLRHMAEVRPSGPDREAAQWAVDHIARLQTALQQIADMYPLSWKAPNGPSVWAIAKDACNADA